LVNTVDIPYTRRGRDPKEVFGMRRWIAVIDLVATVEWLHVDSFTGG
jgi:hypothetical protein